MRDREKGTTLENLMVIKLPALSESMIANLRSECGMLDSAMTFLMQCRNHPETEEDDDSFDLVDTLRSAHFILAGVRERLAYFLAEQHPGAMIAADHLTHSQRPTTTKGEPSTLAKDSLTQIFYVQRTQIAKAMSIIEACRLGSDSMLAPLQDDESEDDDDESADPDFDGAYTVAYDIIEVVKLTLRGISTVVR